MVPVLTSVVIGLYHFSDIGPNTMKLHYCMKLSKNMNRKLLIIIISLFAASCGKVGSNSEGNGVAEMLQLPGDSRLEQAYIAYKNIPKHAEDMADRAFSSFKLDNQLTEELAKRGLSDEDKIAIREAINRLLLERYLAKVVDEELTDQVVEEYFNSNKEKFGNANYRVKIYSIRFFPNADSQAIEMDSVKLREYRDKLASGLELSTGPGEFDIRETEVNLASESIEPKIAELIEPLSIGEYSDVTVSDKGAKFIQLLEKTASTPEFSDVQNQVRNAVIAEIEQKAVQDLRKSISFN